MRLRAAGCVFAEDEAALLAAEAATPQELDALVALRASGRPLEHVVGWAEFCGLRIAVGPGVFVPRRRTEFLAGLARRALREAVARAPRPVAVDLGCGSGALAAALAADAVPGAELHAADVDPVAVQWARRNLAAFGARVHQGDLFDALPSELRGRIAVLTANMPYVPSGEIGLLPSEARDHEPRVALDGGPDGLAPHRRVAAEAAAGWLAPGGVLLVETSDRQAAGALAAFRSAGLAARVERCTETDATAVIGTQPSENPAIRIPRADP
ncbi:hypothetical protein BIV57_07565 [Mangrovactinospora gilvigrisea]|uniref:peptide chain release factor N(5)-glutamine methyltransferase n=1 Tax=Mangrovactinospora gilvigrisea TaxID=1428644 RepID=A0A1J7CEJ6_9ACTN|nr:hypothetical protein BIV57_07565 [Mangrovactinospora gilvigrisea]